MKTASRRILFSIWGLCNGAGWATSLDGRDAVLLGIEKIIELNWQDESAMQALIFHEIGHIWHKTYGNLYPEARSEGEKSLAQLYQEGLAMVCEHILCQDDRYYHQNQNGWLDWCKENEAEIKREYLRRVDKNISTQDFFGIGAATKITAMLAIIWAASSSNICSGNTRLSI